MPEHSDENASFPGADEADVAAEQIIPPEQVPMDDAAGGPQAEPSSDDPATSDTSTDDLAVQGGE